MERRIFVQYTVFGKSGIKVSKLGFGCMRLPEVTVDGKKVNIPSYLVKPGQTIALKEESRSLTLVKGILETTASRPVPKWLDLNKQTSEAKVVAMATREDIDLPIEETLIVELYSK